MRSLLFSMFLALGTCLPIENANAEFMIIQVCRPDKTSVDNDDKDYTSIEEALIRKGGGSFGGIVSHFAGKTEDDHPVYEAQGWKLGETVGISVSLSKVGAASKRSRIQYWYQKPKGIVSGKFTNWNEPISQETQEKRNRNPFTFQKLLKGETPVNYPVDYEAAPKIRFMLAGTDVVPPRNSPKELTLPICKSDTK